MLPQSTRSQKRCREVGGWRWACLGCSGQDEVLAVVGEAPAGSELAGEALADGADGVDAAAVKPLLAVPLHVMVAARRQRRACGGGATVMNRASSHHSGR